MVFVASTRTATTNQSIQKQVSHIIIVSKSIHTMHKIVFIGGGNMATALASGLHNSGTKAHEILVIEPNASARARIEKSIPDISVESSDENIEAPHTVILSVKPQDMSAASKSLRLSLGTHKPLIISIAAGITLKQLHKWLGASATLVRCMPNTPALLGYGSTALSCGTHCNEAQRQNAKNIMSSVGMTVWCDESLMDAVTAVSGSGPAYFFLLTEALVTAGRSLGLPEDMAKQLSVHTALGAAHMMCEQGADITELRKRVTSPGGTTERALAVLQEGGMMKLWMDAIASAAEHSAKLSLKATH